MIKNSWRLGLACVLAICVGDATAQSSKEVAPDWVSSNYSAVVRELTSLRTPVGPDPRITDVRITLTVLPPGLRRTELEFHAVVDVAYDGAVVITYMEPAIGIRAQMATLHAESPTMTPAAMAERIQLHNGVLRARPQHLVSRHVALLPRLRFGPIPSGDWLVDPVSYEIEISRTLNVFRFSLAGSDDPRATHEHTLIEWAKTLRHFASISNTAPLSHRGG